MSNSSVPIVLYNVAFIRLIVWGYIGIILSVFGIVGNLITIIVLLSPSMRVISTNIYLAALSFSNIVFLLIFMLFLSIRYLSSNSTYFVDQSPTVFQILIRRIHFSPVYHTTLISIIYLTIAVSMDRLILIKYPLRAKQILTQRTTRIVILSIYFFSIIYCIPLWLVRRYDPKSNSWRSTSIGKKIDKRIRTYIYAPVVHLIPFITLTCINITIIKNLIARKRWKRSLGVQTNIKRQTDNYIVVILVTVVILFNLCQLPAFMLNVWDAFDEFSSYSDISLYLSTTGGSLMLLYMSTNFLFYCFSAERFRHILIELFLQLLPNHKKQSNFQTRTPRSSARRESLTFQRASSLEVKAKIFAENPLPIAKFTDLDDATKENLINNEQELFLLRTNTNTITVLNGKYPNQYEYLCTCV